MPPEFKAWKEKVDAVEAKKSNAAAVASVATTMTPQVSSEPIKTTKREQAAAKVLAYKYMCLY